MEQCPQYFEENDFQANILYPATVSIRYEGRIKTLSVTQYLKKLYLIYPLTKSYCAPSEEANQERGKHGLQEAGSHTGTK